MPFKLVTDLRTPPPPNHKFSFRFSLTTGIIHAFNAASQEMFGYTLLEVVGKNVKMLMPAPDKNRHDTYLENYIKTGKAKV